jgi:diguanylate cyclase (GGDEF)-like protein
VKKNDEDVHPVAADLAKFEMLAGVSLTVRQDLLHEAEEKHLEVGDVIIRQGEPNTTMFLLTNGELAVHLDAVDNEPLALIAQGELVGELSLLDGSVASASVTAHTRCTVLAIGEETFWRLTKDSHAFALQLLLKLAERLRANNNTVSSNVKKRRMFERAAMFDGLTGIHNRRWLDETLHRLVKRQQQDSGHLAISLIDIDHFKKFNDTYGHDAGDHVLTSVARALAANLRPTDLVARFGGEEFVIIFPETSLQDAATVADRVRKAISSEPMETQDGTKLPSVTISMGIAELEAGQTVPSLLKVADSAMYRAKRAGRNQIQTGTSATIEV